MKSDLEIAQNNVLQPITEIANKLNIPEEDIESYGKYKAKIASSIGNKKVIGKLVLVTSINPTPAGEGKSTVSIGLTDGLNKIGEKAVAALREPSLGPVMGMKGGAAGGGFSQVVPMEDINLHFTGDFHALTSAHDTLSALIDNHIYQGNELEIDPRRIIWKRVLDINDRELRHINVGLGGVTSGVPREDGFDITVASELMAVLTLAKDFSNLKERIGNIVIGYTYANSPVTVNQLGVTGAIATLLKDAIKPNLVQTLEHNPAIIHGGPFANIAQGTNSVQATRFALENSDFTVTEAGFGSDLGAEKFLDIKVPILEKAPDVIVIVVTIRAIRHHGGQPIDEINQTNIEALQKGIANLDRHVNAMRNYQIPIVVAINRFESDSEEELEFLKSYLEKEQIPSEVNTSWKDGGEGSIDLAKQIVAVTENSENSFQALYQATDSISEKIQKIVSEIYGGKSFELSNKATRQLKQIEKNGWGSFPVVMAKTQYSLTDDAKKIGAPTDFTITINELLPKTGAEFIVAITGNVLTMPGLPKHPAALDIDIDDNKKISGLF